MDNTPSHGLGMKIIHGAKQEWRHFDDFGLTPLQLETRFWDIITRI